MSAQGQAMMLVIVYMLGMILVSVYVYLKYPTQRASSFLLADRGMGPVVTALGAVSAGATGWVYTGWVAAGYTLGVSAIWYAFTAPFIQLFSFRYIAPKVRRLSAEKESLTLEVAIGDIKGDPYNLIKISLAVIIIVLMMAFTGAQIVAMGIFMEPSLGVNYTLSITIATACVLTYVLLGGFRAALWTDAIQSVLMIFAYLGVPIILIIHLGGLGSFFDAVGSIKPALLSISAGKSGGVAAMYVLGWFAIGTSYFGFPPIVQKYLAIKDERSLSSSLVVASFFETSRYFFPVITGMALRIMMPDIGNPEQAYATLTTTYFPGIIGGLLIAGFLAAVMSSVSTYCLLVSGAVTHTLYEKTFRIARSPEFVGWITRIMTFVSLAVAFAIGVYKIQSILYFAMFAFGTAGVSYAVPLVFGFFWKKTTSWGILAGILAASLGCVGWMVWSPFYPLVREQLCGLSLGIVALVVVSLLTQGSSKAWGSARREG